MFISSISVLLLPHIIALRLCESEKSEVRYLLRTWWTRDAVNVAAYYKYFFHCFPPHSFLPGVHVQPQRLIVVM